MRRREFMTTSDSCASRADLSRQCWTQLQWDSGVVGRGLGWWAWRLLGHRWGDDGCTAFDVFDAVTTHTVASGHTRPIHTPIRPILSTRAFTAKPPDNGSNRRLCLSRPNDLLCRAIVGASNRSCRGSSQIASNKETTGSTQSLQARAIAP